MERGAEAAPPRRRTALLLAGAALVALVAAIYVQTAGFGFIEVYDDHHYVTDNPVVLRGLTPEGLRWAFADRYRPYWQPLTMLSHMLDVELFGARSGPHHLVNAGLHALNAVLLLLFLRAATGSAGRSLLAAALFAAHPLHVESVAWIAERKDVLSASFLLLTLLAWLRFCRRPGALRSAAVAAAFAAACMAKPMVVTLPLALLLLDRWPLGRWGLPGDARGGAQSGPGARRLLGEKIPLFALAAAVGAATIAVQRATGALSSLDQLPLAARVANAALSCAKYLGKLLWPARLAIAYPHPGAGIALLPVAGALLLLASLTWAALRATRRPALATGWLWFLLGLTPVLGIVQSGQQSMADRFAYVPAIGLYVALAWSAGELAGRASLPRRAAVAAAAGIVVVALALAARAQARHWKDSVTLFSRAVAVSPESGEARKTLGKALILAGRPGEAVEHSRAALRRGPATAEIHNDLGTALYASGARAEGVGHFLDALRLRPDHVQALANLATARADAGRIAEAAQLYERALALAPGSKAIRGKLDLARRRLGGGAQPAR